MEPDTQNKRGRYAFAALALVLGTVVFGLMANERQVPHGALWGGIALFACVASLLRAFGLLKPADPSQPSLAELFDLAPHKGEPRIFAPGLVLPSALLLVLATSLTVGGHALPWVIAFGLLWLLPGALRRPAWLALVIPSLVSLPMLGSYGLWDPWETHYGEVSREILSRDDWISLWWAQDRWFWSKPIYIFWSEALTWSASGIGYVPDSHFQHSEWVLRLPIFVVSLAGLAAVYGAIARAFGRRAGCLSAIVLATTPYYGFLGHQSITDMPFVGLMTVAVMLLITAVHQDPNAEARRYRVFSVSVSAQELVLGLFLMLTLPQVLYLASRNITFTEGLFAWHRDEIMFGSGHNPKVPGNFGIHDQAPWSNAIYTQPLAQALGWAASIATVTFMLCRERRVQGLVMFAFYIVCALAFMAKGIPGFALPGLVAFLYLLTCSRFELLLSGKLRIAAGALTLTTVGMPWFVAMFIRHGTGFTDRILVHDHINRLTTGVHGDKGSVQYFIQQLGYGMFPWFALLPAALAGFVAFYARGNASATSREDGRAQQTELLILLGLWFVATFTLFSAMTTKFHHYVFPAVPPASILIGLLLDRMLGEQRFGRRRTLPAAVLAALAPLPLVLGVAGLFGDVRGVLPNQLGMAQRALWSLQHKWPLALCVGFIAVGLAAISIAVITLMRVRSRDAGKDARSDTYVDAGAKAGADGSEGHGALAGALIAGALVVAFIGRDLSWVTAERPAGYERLIHLFVYNYERPWPAELDYRAILTGFAVVATTLVLGTAIRALRPVLTLSFVGVATLFSLWCLDVYMIDLSPHWGQQELIERYYKERKDSSEPIVAWQMNWKGENFYTGNRVAVFVSLNNKELDEWLKKNKGKRAFFVLEHKRLDRLKRALGARKVEIRSTERENNKFVLVRAIL